MTREEREEMQRVKAALADALLPKRVPAWQIALAASRPAADTGDDKT